VFDDAKDPSYIFLDGCLDLFNEGFGPGKCQQKDLQNALAQYLLHVETVSSSSLVLSLFSNWSELVEPTMGM